MHGGSSLASMGSSRKAQKLQLLQLVKSCGTVRSMCVLFLQLRVVMSGQCGAAVVLRCGCCGCCKCKNLAHKVASAARLILRISGCPAHSSSSIISSSSTLRTPRAPVTCRYEAPARARARNPASPGPTTSTATTSGGRAAIVHTTAAPTAARGGVSGQKLKASSFMQRMEDVEREELRAGLMSRQKYAGTLRRAGACVSICVCTGVFDDKSDHFGV